MYVFNRIVNSSRNISSSILK